MPIKITNFDKLLKLFFLLVGLVVRFYLIISFPLWSDESISTMVMKAPLGLTLLGTADPVHPPLFYLFLKVWGIVSDHLVWLRMSSLAFFILNVFLLNKIGRKLVNDKFSLILIFSYIFSGYFVIFDWQVRMYTGLLTLILLSWYLFIKKRWLFFTIVNTLGLYFDYGFFFYLAPLAVVIFVGSLKEGKLNKTIFWSLISSFLLFLVWFPLQFFNRGLSGIGWLKDYLAPDFFLPYFFGLHKFVLLLAIFPLLVLGIFALNKEKSRKLIWLILFSALLSLTGTWIFSYFFSPLLHVRSLQIVGLASLLLISLGLYQLSRHRSLIVWLVFALYLVNFFLIARLIFIQPGKLLVNPYPWRALKEQKIDKTDITFVVFQKTNNLLLSPTIWGLKYTLWGKESLGSREVPFFEVAVPPKSNPACHLLYNDRLLIYGCKGQLVY